MAGSASSRSKLPPALLPAGLVVTVGLLWLPRLGDAFGPSHDGVVNSRFALHVRNFVRDGFVGSDYLSSVEPYASQYANHPPLPHFVQAAVSIVFGTGEFETRAYPAAMGLLAVASAYLLFRTLGHARPVAAATTAIVVTCPMFWLYGRVLWDIPVLFLLPALTIRAAEATAATRRRRTAELAGVAAIAVLGSYIGAAFAGLCLLWLVRERRARGDRLVAGPVVPVAGAIAVGVALTMAWQAAAGSLGSFGDNVSTRSTGGDTTLSLFVEAHRTYVPEMYSLPAILLALAGVWFVRADGRARVALLVTAVGTAALVFGFPYGAIIHEYWSYPALVPLGIAVAAALSGITSSELHRRSPGLVPIAGVALAGLVVVTLAASPAVSRTRDAAAAGALARSVEPPPSQEIAWSDLLYARWLAFYWDIPTAAVDPDDPRAGDADLVLLRRSFAQDRYGLGEDDFRATDGDYVVVTMASLRSG